ncbi:MAG: hypothetical protein M1820_003400 [Bogoriella megaspora]|nr:MAG: hypothetical protein M1820_003400 [Bogoriella megaspora]
MANTCCAQGTIHIRSQPVGEVKKLHGYDCYISTPPAEATTKGIIIFIPDAFGWEFPNNRLLSDAYARSGYLTYLPEFMAGTAAPAFLMEKIGALEKSDTGILAKVSIFATFLWHFIPWKIRNRPAVCQPRIWEFIEGVRASEEAKDKKIGAAGFCWGGKFVFLLCGSQGKGKDGKWLIDAGFTAHPSNLTIPWDIEDVQVPISVAAAENDMGLSTEKTNEIRTILAKKTEKAEPECELVDYRGAHHGFAVRGDEGEEAMERMDKCKDQAVNWFAKRFAKDTQS